MSQSGSIHACIQQCIKTLPLNVWSQQHKRSKCALMVQISPPEPVVFDPTGPVCFAKVQYLIETTEANVFQSGKEIYKNWSGRSVLEMKNNGAFAMQQMADAKQSTASLEHQGLGISIAGPSRNSAGFFVRCFAFSAQHLYAPAWHRHLWFYTTRLASGSNPSPPKTRAKSPSTRAVRRCTTMPTLATSARSSRPMYSADLLNHPCAHCCRPMAPYTKGPVPWCTS